ncbi:MAG: hypothetical protein ACYS9T_09465 [Planctomycetota bacterium]
MNKADGNEQIDDDIVRSREDVLRARDIMPPYKEDAHEEPKTPKDSERAASPTGETESVEKEEDTTRALREDAEAQRKESEIPRFDLAEKIMAEQRRITAIKRKAPGKQIEPKTKGPADKRAGHTIAQPTSATPLEHKIIADIVSRDIERLLRGEGTDA